ncbi:1,4-alpha-glucan branching protein [Streptomyces sp. UNOC14_S4]|uniref:maltokinase N-terminal cap-like domain-containing protein n=1 Tax=Streptomyces sp. UNOC14_S4 TaxID=2872340 RepID=UPI001E406BC2|nr:1,4-alpha-glucan branching protein [Streptomyces sp. UNOC14_S4]MCC3767818.1 1,4-alpha-glucan branching protein [Streptomyces sp. UNOC14_S4]
MAVIHRTTVAPSKEEMLTAWLPTRSWYRGSGSPELKRVGGFRLDDPEGEVGIEFMVMTDVADAEPVTYLCPLTYRGAPLEGAEDALVSTMEHGVLGDRWAYDGCHDPVLVAELVALIEGRAQAQAQSVSDTPDHEIGRSFAGTGPLPVGFEVADGRDGTELAGPDGLTVRVHRVLRHGDDACPADAMGHVAGHWSLPDGTRTRGVFFSLRR